MIPRADFIAAVRSCIGTPVVHMGRVIGEGLDCVGLPWAAARLCGLELPPTRRYTHWPTADEMAAGLAEFCDRTMHREEAHLWQVFAGRQLRHVVVPTGVDDRGREIVAHAWGKRAKVVEIPLIESVGAYWRIRWIA